MIFSLDLSFSIIKFEGIIRGTFFDEKKLLLRPSAISKCTKIWIYLFRTVCAVAVDSNICETAFLLKIVLEYGQLEQAG